MTSDQASERPRIGINAHLLSGQQNYRRAGIHNYIAQILRHIAATDSSYDLSVYCNSPQALSDSNLKVVTTRFPAEKPLGRILWEQLAWPIAARRHKLDLLHSTAFVTPYLNTIPSIVTVYDLSFVRYPELFPRMRQKYLASQTRRSCRSARRVVTISQSGRRDVHELFGVATERIDVVNPGVDNIFHRRSLQQVADFRRQQNLPERCILHVGTLQPRKNIPLLIEAFAGLEIDDVVLILVGGKGWLYNEIFEHVRALGLERRVLFPGYVPDEDLPLWYNAAAALVFPSIYEGFGMPMVEAMACGTPVIAARTSAVPEATGDAAMLFEPHDVMALRESLTTVLDDLSLAATMREKGFVWANNYSWHRAARETLEVYGKALAES
jgi:glycosyltransferase involved in cell wall biosynthesis